MKKEPQPEIEYDDTIEVFPASPPEVEPYEYPNHPTGEPNQHE